MRLPCCRWTADRRNQLTGPHKPNQHQSHAMPCPPGTPVLLSKGNPIKMNFCLRKEARWPAAPRRWRSIIHSAPPASQCAQQGKIPHSTDGQEVVRPQHGQPQPQHLPRLYATLSSGPWAPFPSQPVQRGLKSPSELCAVMVVAPRHGHRAPPGCTHTHLLVDPKARIIFLASISSEV